MDDKQQVLMYVKDLEKIAALINNLAWEIKRRTMSDEKIKDILKELTTKWKGTD